MRIWKNKVYDYSDAKKIGDVIPDAFVRKLNLNQSELPAYKCGKSKGRYVRGVFFDFLALMIDDLIENNYQFVSPNRYSFKVYIRQKARAEQRRLLTRTSKIYKDVDLIASQGKFYEFCLHSWKLPGKKSRKVRIGHHKYKDLTRQVNNGRRYFER